LRSNLAAIIYDLCKISFSFFCLDAKEPKNQGRRFGTWVTVVKDYNRQNNSSRRNATGITLVVKHILPPVGSCSFEQHCRQVRRGGLQKQLRPKAAIFKAARGLLSAWYGHRDVPGQNVGQTNN